MVWEEVTIGVERVPGDHHREGEKGGGRRCPPPQTAGWKKEGWMGGKVDVIVARAQIPGALLPS